MTLNEKISTYVQATADAGRLSLAFGDREKISGFVPHDMIAPAESGYAGALVRGIVPRADGSAAFDDFTRKLADIEAIEPEGDACFGDKAFFERNPVPENWVHKNWRHLCR